VVAPGFEVVCEIEPATNPDLRQVRHQVGALSAVSATFLVPDNHIGRATVSSIAVAHEVLDMGGSAIACLNARDRNTLGFRRDLLTAAAYGVSEFLFVYGDRPEQGRRSDDLTVKTMLRDARAFSAEHLPGQAFRTGVVTALGPLPEWKQDADFVFTQVSFSVERLLEWRQSLDFAGPVYAGVMVIASAQMARKLATNMPQLTVPHALVSRLELDPDAGIELACQMVGELRDSNAFAGVHLVPVRKYRQVAQQLEAVLQH
jgi:methylenetetrahydrofolate reductase (NADPH)